MICFEVRTLYVSCWDVILSSCDEHPFVQSFKVLLKPCEINFVFMYVKSDLIKTFNPWFTMDKPQVMCNWLNLKPLLLFAKER
jgi:hypothetical protein